MLLLLMLLILLYINAKNALKNINALRRQLDNLRSSDIHVMVVPVARKLKIMRTYLKLVYFYLLSQIFCILVL